MRVGVIPHVLPLLFTYDATAEADDGEQGGSTAAAEATMVGEGAMAAAEERGPKFLGLGIVRSNMQVRQPWHCKGGKGTDCMATVSPPCTISTPLSRCSAFPPRTKGLVDLTLAAHWGPVPTCAVVLHAYKQGLNAARESPAEIRSADLCSSPACLSTARARARPRSDDLCSSPAN